MPNLDALRRLTAEMYSQTRRCQDSAQHAAACRSAQFVKRAPVQRLSPAEQAGRMHALHGAITSELLNSSTSMDATRLRQGLGQWQGARMRS